MIQSIEAVDKMLAHITNREHIWDSSKFVYGAKRSHAEVGMEYQFTWNYQMGTAFVSGTLGKEAVKFELWFSANQGWQIHWPQEDGETEVNSFAPHLEDDVKEMLYHAITI